MPILKNALIVAILSGGMFISSCNNKPDEPQPTEDNGKINIKINIHKNNLPLQLKQTYTTDSIDFNAHVLRFYIGDFSLVKEDGSSVLVKDVLLADIATSIDPPIDENSIGANFTYTVPAGNYKAVKLGIGVPKRLNVNSSDHPNDHPLSVFRGMDWSWAGYRFLVFEGEARKKGSTDFKPFNYHVLFDTFYQERTLQTPVEIKRDGTTTYLVSVDVDKFLIPENGQPINLITEAMTHSEGSEERIKLAGKVIDNFASAINK